MAPDELLWQNLTDAEQAFVKEKYVQLFRAYCYWRDGTPLRFVLKGDDVVVSLVLPLTEHVQLIHTPMSLVYTWMHTTDGFATAVQEIKCQRYRFWQKKWLRRKGHWHVFDGEIKCKSGLAKVGSQVQLESNGRILITTLV